jgi:hypothetical protein
MAGLNEVHDMTHDIDLLDWQAYLDGELDDDARARIDAAVAADPVLAERLARDLRLQARVRDAFAGALDEPVPVRLQAMLEAAPAEQATATPPTHDIGNVVALPRRNSHRRMLPAWLGYAAAAVLAVIAIDGAWRQTQSPVRLSDGDLVAGGVLADELDRGLASAPNAASSVSIGLTFRSHDGRICRSFTYREDTALSGLACRHNDMWRLSALGGAFQDAGGKWSQASAAMAPELQAAIDGAIAGETFDAEAERAARDDDWR